MQRCSFAPNENADGVIFAQRFRDTRVGPDAVRQDSHNVADPLDRSCGAEVLADAAEPAHVPEQDRALARVWQAERFSWWMTSLLHRFPESSGFRT